MPVLHEDSRLADPKRPLHEQATEECYFLLGCKVIKLLANGQIFCHIISGNAEILVICCVCCCFCTEVVAQFQ